MVRRNIRTMAELKTFLHSIMRRRSAEKRGVSTPELVADLKAEHSALIKELSDQLIEQQLTKLVSAVAQRRIKPGDGKTADLFAGQYGIPGMIEIEISGEMRWRDFTALNVRDARHWAQSRAKARSARSDRNDKVLGLLARLEKSGAKEDMTVARAMEVMRGTSKKGSD